ncbi:high affinity copper uptake protein 1 [Drosophila innubila]|uniref:high affinity copper uptake protein 1 n=1 Tax=Drosophila innubila TaxID=198719 RepID=UPI00148C32C1|nr:high affinity copper uptake protein 1 [Drosophila innubila]
MDLRYNVVKMETPYTQEVRQHEHHHEVSPPSETASSRSSEEASSSGMAMYFHISNVETILFKFWHTNSVLAIVGSCVAVFIVAILYELLKFYREWLKRSEGRRLSGGAHRRRSSRKRHRRSKSVSIGSVDETTMAGTPASYGITERYPWLAPMHWYQTFLHMLQVTISFMLMLVFMTFNVWLCLSVVLGAGLGYFIFFVNDEGFSEHCN